MVKNGNKQVELFGIKDPNEEVEVYDMLFNMYSKHHSTPGRLLCDELPLANYSLLFVGKQCVGMTSYRMLSPKLAMTERTIILPEFRNQGYGKQASQVIEDHLKSKGITKIACEIFTFNHAMLFIKIKQGYLIEGLMRNHDDRNIHQYYLGKEI